MLVGKSVLPTMACWKRHGLEYVQFGHSMASNIHLLGTAWFQNEIFFTSTLVLHDSDATRMHHNYTTCMYHAYSVLVLSVLHARMNVGGRFNPPVNAPVAD